MTLKELPASAGAQLRATLDAALERRSKAIGRALEWDETEAATLDALCRAADRAEDLRQLYATERAGQNRPTVVVKLSAEMRMIDRQVVELVARVNPDLGPPKSARHQRAADARWARHHELRGIDGSVG